MVRLFILGKDRRLKETKPSCVGGVTSSAVVLYY